MKQWIVLAAVVAVCPGCEISDADRCPSGFEWVPEFKSCALDQEDDTGNDTDSENEPAEDAGGDSGPSGGLTGLGEPCYTSDDCEGYDAAECVLNPMAPGQVGFCSLGNCGPGECPTDYLCCDCSNVLPDSGPVCLPTDKAQTAAVYGCECG